MDERALFEAISRMMDEKLTEALEPVKARQDALSADIARLNHEIAPQIKLILESVVDLPEQHGKRLNKVEAKQEEHDDRIWALEQVVKAK